MGLVARTGPGLAALALTITACSTAGRTAVTSTSPAPTSGAPTSGALTSAALTSAALTSGAPTTRPVTLAAKGVRLPPAAGVFDYQLGGAYPPARSAQIIDRDRTAPPVAGRYNVCYVNAFQTQPDEASFWTGKHRSLLLSVGGHLVHDPGWPGEYILDTSTAAKRSALMSIVGGWFDGCARKGYQAVEPDNLDSWTRRGVGGAITRDDNLAFAAALVRRAHARHLAIGQKNAVELSARARRIGFDFAVAEECEFYRECGGYTAQYGRRVIEIEYTDNPRSAYTRACKTRRGKASIILRDRDVVARGNKAYRYSYC